MGIPFLFCISSQRSDFFFLKKVVVIKTLVIRNVCRECNKNIELSGVIGPKMFFSDDALLQVNHSHLLQYYAVGSRCWKELGCIRHCVSSAASVCSLWVG